MDLSEAIECYFQQEPSLSLHPGKGSCLLLHLVPGSNRSHSVVMPPGLSERNTYLCVLVPQASQRGIFWGFQAHCTWQHYMEAGSHAAVGAFQEIRSLQEMTWGCCHRWSSTSPFQGEASNEYAPKHMCASCCRILTQRDKMSERCY